MNEVANRIRFSSDIEEYNALLADEVVAALAEKRLRGANEDSYRRNLLGTGLRVTPGIAPELHRHVHAAQDQLGLTDKHIEIYLYNDPAANASCAYLGAERIILAFSSGLLTTMNTDELNFVVGHELGHALFRHYALPSHGILESGELSAESAMRVMSWSRRAEVSADRTGLYVCQKPEAAISSFLKLSCGVSHPVIAFDLHDYATQIQDLEELANNIADTSHCYSSHPFNPIRVVAVELYSRSTDFRSLAGTGPGELSLDEVDAEINKVLGFMEPAPSEKQQELIDNCVFWGGVWVAHADGAFDDAEIQNLKELVDEELFAERMAVLTPVDDKISFAREKFAEAVRPLKALPAPDRCSIVQRLVVIARADQSIDDKETEALHEACDQLGVERSFVQQILMFLN